MDEICSERKDGLIALLWHGSTEWNQAGLLA